MFSLSGCQLSPKAKDRHENRRAHERALERAKRRTHGVRVHYGKGDVYTGDASNTSKRLPNLFIPHGSGYLTKKNPSPNSKLARYYGNVNAFMCAWFAAHLCD